MASHHHHNQTQQGLDPVSATAVNGTGGPMAYLIPVGVTANSSASAPDRVGSGSRRQLAPAKNLPKFPNNTELVFDDKHSEKYNCLLLVNPSNKPRRSPWVRAFCDLYHPAGPWGSNKFSNAPDITSKRKYSFKSYQIPTLHKQLQKYEGDSVVHNALKQALEDYSEKEEWYKSFLQGCEQVASVEVNKPAAERAAIPTTTAETGLVAAAAAAAAAAVATTSRDHVEEMDVTTGHTCTTSTPAIRLRRPKRAYEDAPASDPPRTRATRLRQQKVVPAADDGSDDDDTARKLPLGSSHQGGVSPESTSAAGGRETRKEILEKKRTELAKLLSTRRASGSVTGRDDPLLEKIQTQIDVADEELLTLILA